MKLRVFISKGGDVYENIALECALAHEQTADCKTLYLWSNKNAVVIGKHQLAAAECDYAALCKDGGALARRLSGGGAVYHDINNLCYSFICTEDNYDQAENYSLLLSALSKVGLNANVSGRNDIEIDGRKFSGNAFYTSNGVKVHHGTLLINTDVDKMHKYLTVDAAKLSGHGVDSVRGRVINLKQINETITKQEITDAIINTAKERFDVVDAELTAKESAFVPNFRILLSSNKWLFGFGKYQNQKSARFSWGDCTVYYSVEKGKISALSIVTDCLFAEKIDRIISRLLGSALPLVPNGDKIFDDVISLLV